jgi:hypothetical protein
VWLHSVGKAISSLSVKVQYIAPVAIMQERFQQEIPSPFLLPPPKAAHKESTKVGKEHAPPAEISGMRDSLRLLLPLSVYI